METKLLDSLKDYGEAVRSAVQIIKSGGIVAIPTETVYGLAANCFNENAVQSIFKAKGRPQDNPLIVHISDMDMLSTVATDIPQTAYKCAALFWPGPFTMVLKRKSTVPASVSAGLDTVAVRMPSDPCAHDIIAAAGLPLAAPSANISGAPSPTRATDVICDLSGKIDAIVVSGDCAVGVESTVVSLVGEPRLLRPGGITVEQLKAVFGESLIIDKAVLSEPEKDKPVASPGMKYKHYSPATKTVLVKGSSAAFSDFVNSNADCAALCFSEEESGIKTAKIVYGAAADCSTLAHGLFTALREADKLKKQIIYVHAPDVYGVGLAVYNRLLRAAAFEVIEL